jgi:hypothetical protein
VQYPLKLVEVELEIGMEMVKTEVEERIVSKYINLQNSLPLFTKFRKKKLKLKSGKSLIYCKK